MSKMENSLLKEVIVFENNSYINFDRGVCLYFESKRL